MKLASQMENLNIDEGYLKAHHLNLRNTISEKQLEELHALNTNEDRFAFVYQLPIAHEHEVKISKSGKDDKEAKILKEEGNKFFQQSNYYNALSSYNKSILKTPWENGKSQEIAITFANRSAVFYHLTEYQLALQDIALVLSLGYPPELHYKVLDRKARCLLAKNKLSEAKDAFRATLKALDSTKLAFERRQKWQMDIQIMLVMLDKNKDAAKSNQGEVESLPSPDMLLPRVTGDKNPKYISASSSVSISHSEDQGRYAVAQTDITVGDVLVVEKPFVAVLLRERATLNCFQCFKRLKALIPCKWCSTVAFCSIACQEEALSTHHAVECPILENLWESGASIICHMALRIISERGLKYFMDIKDTLKQDKGNKPDIKKYLSTDYLNVYNLVTHTELRSALDFLYRADVAVFLLRCLKTGGFFDSVAISKGSELTTVEKFMGGLLLHHLQILQFNAHEISELQLDSFKKLSNGKSLFIGGGLYTTLALFNHSCDPGITRYFIGNYVVARAIKNIKYGEIIGENYGPIFTQTPREQRRTQLKQQYNFDCECLPCIEDWPQLNEMQTGILRFRCDGNDTARCNAAISVPADTPEFMVQCSICKEYTNLLKGLKALQDTDAMFKNATHLEECGKVIEALNSYIVILITLDQTLAPPFKDFNLCQQAIRRCMLSLGNTRIITNISRIN